MKLADCLTTKPDKYILVTLKQSSYSVLFMPTLDVFVFCSVLLWMPLIKQWTLYGGNVSNCNDSIHRMRFDKF